MTEGKKSMWRVRRERKCVHDERIFNSRIMFDGKALRCHVGWGSCGDFDKIKKMKRYKKSNFWYKKLDEKVSTIPKSLS